MPREDIDKAGERYIRTLLRAKAKAPDADAFWKDKKASHAHNQLFKAIKENVPADLNWWYTIWEHAGQTADLILEGRFKEPDATQAFCRDIHRYLDALAGFDWIATVPLERMFGRFPAFTDFGGFAIINPTAGNVETRLTQAQLCQRFIGILSERYNVGAVHPTRPGGQTYADLATHFFHKSGGYIPGRPQMVLRVGRGDEYVNKRILASKVDYLQSLLALCQIAYEQEGGMFDLRVVSPAQSRLPTGEHMPAGLINVPGVAVGINVNTGGHAAWWPTYHSAYETHEGAGYDPAKLTTIWNEIAKPIVDLRSTLSGDVPDAIMNAVRSIGKCRYAASGNLKLFSVIAAETIINPFNKATTSEGFAVFAARLTETSPERRLETYNTARTLYKMRNSIVHKSFDDDDGTLKESRKAAFNLFRSCLARIVGWAHEQVAAGRACDKAAFGELYQRAMFQN